MDEEQVADLETRVQKIGSDSTVDDVSIVRNSVLGLIDDWRQMRECVERIASLERKFAPLGRIIAEVRALVDATVTSDGRTDDG